MIVGCYSLVLLAAAGEPTAPKWLQRRASVGRATTYQIIRAMRGEPWASALGVENLSHFAAETTACANSGQNPLRLPSALIYSPP